MNRVYAALSCALCFAAPCFEAGARAGSSAAAQYVEASGYLRDDAQIDAWYEMRYRLRENFDRICPDTFCAGDYSNLYALRFSCSVEQSSGAIGQCVWVFAASNEEVDPVSGRIQATPKAWRCRSPLAPGTTMSALLGALAGDRPLYATLPGTSVSLYDGLIDCL